MNYDHQSARYNPCTHNYVAQLLYTVYVGALLLIALAGLGGACKGLLYHAAGADYSEHSAHCLKVPSGLNHGTEPQDPSSSAWRSSCCTSLRL